MTDDTASQTAQAKPLEVYKMGLCAMSVCVDKNLDVAEVERLANLEMPTGISSRWQIVEPTFAGGEPNGCPCNAQPEDRAHFVLHC